MDKQERQLRQAIIDKCRWMNARRAQSGDIGQYFGAVWRSHADHAERDAL